MKQIHHSTQAVASSVQTNHEQVVRVTLEAAETSWRYTPGRMVTGYGINGQIPGPVIEAKQGVLLEIQLKNNLPEATVIHWHGLRIPAAMDGELQVWDIVNVAPIDHPFHLHGFFFQVLSVNGQPPVWRSWEDVVNVPGKSTVRIAWLPDDRPGSWMYHCHILDHHAAGMMAHFDVVREGESL